VSLELFFLQKVSGTFGCDAKWDEQRMPIVRSGSSASSDIRCVGALSAG
jgi:hypothetical protein